MASKILFLAANLCSGGAERQMVTVACLLKKHGYDVYVYCYDKADFYAHILHENDISIVWEIENNYLKRILNVRKHIRKGCYDAIISFLPTCNLLNDFASIGGHSWKVITGERSSKDTTFNSRRGKFEGWLQRYSNYIVCNSDNARRKWLSHYPKYENKLVTIYNNVALDGVSSTYQIRKDGKLHIVVAATYQYLKNPIGLVKALLLMNERERSQIVIDWYGRYEICRGDTRAYNETKKLISDNCLNTCFFLHADTKDIANQMNEADVVMLLSQLEGLPNAICEGMTLGKPIIMSRVSDYDTLVDATNGFLCDWNKPETIKEAILLMANCSDQQLQQMGEVSKQKAGMLFSAEKILQKWENLINY